jgi:hypothetical protein
MVVHSIAPFPFSKTYLKAFLDDKPTPSTKVFVYGQSILPRAARFKGKY